MPHFGRCMAMAAGVAMSEAASPTLEWPPASNDPPVLPFRVGLGFDLHRLEEGDYKLIIGVPNPPLPYAPHPPRMSMHPWMANTLFIAP